MLSFGLFGQTNTTIILPFPDSITRLNKTTEHHVFPKDVWKIIIEYTYPLNQGWNNHLWDLATLSKMHYSIVSALFQLYLLNPQFPQSNGSFNRQSNNYFVKCIQYIITLGKTIPEYLPPSAYVKYMTKDAPIMPRGYLLKPGKYVDFTYYSFFNKDYFLDMYFLERYWIADRCVTTNSSVEENIIGMPFIIIPSTHDIFLDKYPKTRLCHMFVIQQYCEETSLITFYYRSRPEAHQTNIIETKSVIKIIQYVQNPDNVIPASINELVLNTNKYYQSNKIQQN